MERVPPSPLAPEGPPGLLRPPFPQAAGRRRGSHRGPHSPGAVAPGLQGPATWPPHVPDNPATGPSPWGVGLLPHPPDAFLQALLERIQTGEGRVERSKNQHSSCCPIHHCPSPFPSGKSPNTTLASYPLQSGLKWQNGYLILLFKKSEIHGPEVRQPREPESQGQVSCLASPKPLTEKPAAGCISEVHTCSLPTLGTSELATQRTTGWGEDVLRVLEKDS